MKEKCALCGCFLHREKNTYARPSIVGRSHASNHHYVAERFFGRSKNRRGTQRTKIFDKCPWDCERKSAIFCYDCHEEILHNPVFLPNDIRRFADLVAAKGLTENNKSESKENLAGRIELLHQIIDQGLSALQKNEGYKSKET